jgi:hypothetical protein
MTAPDPGFDRTVLGRDLVTAPTAAPPTTRPALDANTFNPAPTRSSPRNPYLGDDAAAVDMDALRPRRHARTRTYPSPPFSA